MKLLLTHPGTQYAPLLAAQLHRRQILLRFVTGIAFADNPHSAFWRLMRLAGKDRLAARRMVPGLPPNLLYRLPILEAHALLRVALRHDQDAIFFERNKKFQEKIPERLIKAADAVIGFDTCSWVLAERCHKMGRPYIMDASIAHPLAKEAIFELLRKRFPAWKGETKPKRDINLRAELQEMASADHIVVATSFTKNTYLQHGIAEEKISINPYGTHLGFFTSKWELSTVTNKVSVSGHLSPVSGRPSSILTHPAPVFLFFGNISARKGFPWLCEVWQALHAKYPACELVAAGHGVPPEGFILPKGVRLLGSIHPNDRTQLFHQADVFVFPSFFEGFAQVIIEAMACGLPVITTTHTVGPEVISDGEEGFVIEPGNDGALLESMLFFIENLHEIERMGRAARERVLPYTWDAYGDRWEQIAANLTGLQDL